MKTFYEWQAAEVRNGEVKTRMLHLMQEAEIITLGMRNGFDVCFDVQLSDEELDGLAIGISNAIAARKEHYASLQEGEQTGGH